MVAIASISLLVGGIGIMNIMLASVMERTREIGVRRAIGAKKRDVIRQFLIETTIISLTGGVVGVIVGVGLSQLIGYLAGWSTIVTTTSIVLAFVVSVGDRPGLRPLPRGPRRQPGSGQGAALRVARPRYFFTAAGRLARRRHPVRHQRLAVEERLGPSGGQRPAVNPGDSAWSDIGVGACGTPRSASACSSEMKL